MGNFFAHIFPGAIFFLVGWWYFYNILMLYLKRGVHVHQNVFNIVLEAFAKIILCFSGMVSECFSAKWILIMSDEEEDTHPSADWQHFTMYLLFLLTGVFDIVSSKYGNMGRTLSHISYIFAYFLESSLFYTHAEGRPVLDAESHKLLAYSGIGVSGALVYLLFNQTSVVASCLYSSFVVLHGLWFIEVAFIILSPFSTTKWDLSSHAHAMIANVLFCWSYISVVMLMLLFVMLSDKNFGRRKPPSKRNIETMEIEGLLDSEN